MCGSSFTSKGRYKSPSELPIQGISCVVGPGSAVVPGPGVRSSAVRPPGPLARSIMASLHCTWGV